MGFLDGLKKKPEDAAEKKKEVKAEKPQEPAKYVKETCSLCGGAGTDKKWMGQFWHKKCLRKMKKTAKGMI